MDRKTFLISIGAGVAAWPFLKYFMEIPCTQQMPVLFVGHGSPMNIINDNSFTRAMREIGEKLPRPRAILSVSAHWMTPGTRVSRVAKPEQIFDFHGFPEELYQVQYTPPGAPNVAEALTQGHSSIVTTEEWGIDHGTWSVLHHMYPKQDIPTFQLSLNTSFAPDQHLALAKDLQALRARGVLILASGNIVHNLRRISWNESAKPHDWALEFEEHIIRNLEDQNLSSQEKLKRIFTHKLLPTAHPTLEHLLPLFYALGAGGEVVKPVVVTRGIQNASVSMAAFQF